MPMCMYRTPPSALLPAKKILKNGMMTLMLFKMWDKQRDIYFHFLGELPKRNVPELHGQISIYFMVCQIGEIFIKNC